MESTEEKDPELSQEEQNQAKPPQSFNNYRIEFEKKPNCEMKLKDTKH